jgi:hypothetical protein
LPSRASGSEPRGSPRKSRPAQRAATRRTRALLRMYTPQTAPSYRGQRRSCGQRSDQFGGCRTAPSFLAAPRVYVSRFPGRPGACPLSLRVNDRPGWVRRRSSAAVAPLGAAPPLPAPWIVAGMGVVLRGWGFVGLVSRRSRLVAWGVEGRWPGRHAVGAMQRTAVLWFGVGGNRRRSGPIRCPLLSVIRQGSEFFERGAACWASP